MLKHLLAYSSFLLLFQSVHAASWELVAGAPAAVHAGRLDAPRGIAVGRDDTIYFTDGASVRAMRPDGNLLTLPGHFIAPSGLALGADGTLFVADAGNHVVKALTPAGEVRTVAGQAGTAGRNDGKGIAARFDRPAGLALDAAGALLVADVGNSALRRIAADGNVSTLAQRLPLQPQGVTLDASGAALVYDASSALRIGADGKWQELDMQPTDAGAASLASAIGAAGAPADRLDGEHRASAMAAGEAECRRGKCLRRYSSPSMPVLPAMRAMPAGQMAADAQGRLLVTVPAAGTIYRIERNGMIAPLLGVGDVTGELSGAALDSAGGLHVLLAGRQLAGSWDASGKPRPFALQYAASLNRDGPALQARFSDITGLAVGRDGGLYVLDGDQLRRIDKEGVVRTLLQEGGFHRLLESHTAAQVDLHGSLAARPSTGVFVTANGGLAGVSSSGDIAFVSGPPGMQPDETGAAAAFKRIWAYAAQDAEPFLLPGLGQHRLAADATGQAWYCADKVLWRIRPRGAARKIALQGEDGCGEVLVAPNDLVYLLHGHFITRVGADGFQTLAAGSRERKGHKDGTGLQARFSDIQAAAFDSAGNLHVVDNGAVRKLAADGDVTTEVGTAGGPHGTLFDLPSGAEPLRAVASDRKGTLYLASRHAILKVK